MVFKVASFWIRRSGRLSLSSLISVATAKLLIFRNVVSEINSKIRSCCFLDFFIFISGLPVQLLHQFGRLRCRRTELRIFQLDGHFGPLPSLHSHRRRQVSFKTANYQQNELKCLCSLRLC